MRSCTIDMNACVRAQSCDLSYAQRVHESCDTSLVTGRSTDHHNVQARLAVLVIVLRLSV